jgi:hypothetical protein
MQYYDNIQPFTAETLTFLLTNSLKYLTEEQRKCLCLDLYSRSQLKKEIENGQYNK